MPNMSLTKVPMPEQDPNVRNKNFEEVALGYTKEMAMEEATRCINCKNKPCMSGCPVCVRIPEFIAKVAAGEFEEAAVGTDTRLLPAPTVFLLFADVFVHRKISVKENVSVVSRANLFLSVVLKDS